jgi:hypothetical protein
MDLPYPKFRSRTFLLAQRLTNCWYCGGTTRVAAVGLPVDHEVLDDDEESDALAWQSVADVALLFFIEKLSKNVRKRLRTLAPRFQLMHGAPTQDSYWVNHCEHCNAVLDDHELHCEPGDTFVPISEADGSEIRLAEIHEAFHARAGGYSLAPQFVPFARSR